MLQAAGASSEQIAPVQQQIQQADQALQRNEAARALDAIQAASQTLTTLQPLIAQVKSINGKIEATQAALDSLSPTQAATVRDLLEQAKTALQRSSQNLMAPDSANQLQEAAWLADHAFKLGPDFERTKQDLRQRLDTLIKQFEPFQQRLQQGREEFDIVDEYAPSAWSDIRGNGSEATAAVAQAQQFTEQARQEMSAQMGDWAKILELVETAEARLNYADQLLTAITTRLHDLRQAQKKAGNEVENAKRDVKLGWGYVRNNDADVGKAPERSLKEADAILQTIDQQLQSGRPDWMLILQQAAQVRHLADNALAGARSEVEQMNALRQQVEDIAQVAQAELNKLANFAQVHPHDVTAEQRRQIDELAALLAQSAQQVAQAEQAEEKARTSALQQAYAGYKQVLDQAQPLYTAMYEVFQRLETLRTEANTITQTARQSIDNTASWYNSYGQTLPVGSEGRTLLEKAQRKWRAFNPQASEAELRKVIEANKEANQLAHKSAEIIQEAARKFQQTPQYEHNRRRDGMDLDDMLTGMFIGQMLGGGGQRSNDSWGGGWGGSWGSGSSSGGGGGLFGGGGGSIGGWGGGGGGDSGGWGGDVGGGGGDSGSW